MQNFLNISIHWNFLSMQFAKCILIKFCRECKKFVNIFKNILHTFTIKEGKPKPVLPMINVRDHFWNYHRSSQNMNVTGIYLYAFYILKSSPEEPLKEFNAFQSSVLSTATWNNKLRLSRSTSDQGKPNNLSTRTASAITKWHSTFAPKDRQFNAAHTANI